MILAIDQGTTGTTCLVVDEQAARGRARLPRDPAVLPRAGAGRARPRGDLGERRADRSRRARRSRDPRGRPGSDRDHEPARDDGRLGAGHHATGASGDRVAGPADGRAVHVAPRGARAPAHRARTRSVLLGHEARVDPRAHGGAAGRAGVRDDRCVARVEADRRRGARHRRHERVADDAPRPRIGSLGRRAARAVRGRPRGAPDGRGLVGRRRRGVAPRRPRAGGRDRGRPAGSALRTGLLCGRGRRRRPTGRGRSCSSPSARIPANRSTGCSPPPQQSSRAPRRGMRPRVLSSSAAQHCSGSATGSA